MADGAVSAQLQQWSFEKSRPERADSSASSPRLDQAENETLALKIEDAAAVQAAASPGSKDAVVLQACYLSSEEDLSAAEGDFSSDSECDDVLSIHDGETGSAQVRQMSIARFDKGRSCDLAVQVSYLSAGRPKVIHLATVGSPTRDTPPQRSASLAALPMAAVNRLKHLGQASRMSLAAPSSSSTSRSPSPGRIPEVRRPSTSSARFSQHSSSLRVDDSTRSSSPAVSAKSIRPASVAASRPSLLNNRSSLFVSSSTLHSRQFAPLTPLSPGIPSFLSSDPYENSTTSAASPILKSSPHGRLRSISKKLALAKIAITPSTKKWDSRIHTRPSNMPLTPASPYTPRTPITPQTAPPTTFAPPNRLRRNSRFSPASSVRVPSPENVPAVPARNISPTGSYAAQKLVPRGANEREPTLELPDFPDDTFDAKSLASFSKAKKIRKRKSLMDLLQQ